MAFDEAADGLALLRVPVAVLVAAGTPATILAIGAALSSPTSFTWVMFIWLIAFLIALLHAVILGIPMYFLIRRLELAKWWAGLVCGFVIGAGPWTVVLLVGYGSLRSAYQSGELRESAIAGAFGAASGFAAWLTWHLLGRRIAGARPAM